MNEQRSFDQTAVSGALYLVPTPIGNLQDMTYRAVDTLKSVTMIAAEDTRRTKNLCRAFEIDARLISYHEHNKQEKEAWLVERIRAGDTIALVSDAGTPAISDPGADLVERLTAENLPVISLPGANAALTALVSSGLPTDAFTFIGFVDRHKKNRAEILASWRGHAATLIFYESPYRVSEFLNAAYEAFGNRRAVIARELTKQFETVVRGTLAELCTYAKDETLKGECVLLIEGASEQEQLESRNPEWWEHLSVLDHVEAYVQNGEAAKEAIKKTARDRGMPKRDVYHVYHIEEND
ncbi:16S rRNA (cytidine(1402)-2'-O)-methyltransferase [Salisediminibacterium halotolerans]|uniref:Ribosomal RNA small subunit methyltransferase I n=1 Tax=Salisediminibacterium halotolerans TaxID=517425 RepID=A0A1H9VRH9_9BACI|nr:16S rRNA (cytidine(1402)-2'-O)-methyltransferase [Salisediminibacterium haloalkalitolerans]SES24114.1 16S rRNA (cytidine1402-2'-O)-methyltransferase [Salisediminibacterium haloalkalitolerans]